MNLSLKDLQTIMEPLTKLGSAEATFEAEGIQITIRNLTPEEETSTQRYARVALTEGDANDQINAMDFLDRFRTACLGIAIVQIGDRDLRDVSTSETGEMLPIGVAVKIKKNEALMRVIEAWSRQMTTAVFNRFTSLMERIESAVDKSMKFDDDHIDAEIARLTERLTELNAMKTKVKAGETDARDGVTEAASTAKKKAVEPVGAVDAPVTWENVKPSATSDDAPLSVAQPSDIPKTVDAPPTEKPEAPVERKSMFGQRPVVREPVQAVQDPLAGIESSLVDTSDPDVIEQENRRLMAERAKRMAPPPPHLLAKEAAKSIEQAGTLDGLPVYKMPVETLAPDDKAPRLPLPVVKSNVNPNFRPAK